MKTNKHPTLSNGKVCYLEIPAIRKRGDGSVAFDDAVGEVSGTWVLGRKAATEPGLLIYILLHSS